MNFELSKPAQQFLDQMVADGVFPTMVAAMEAAVAALREKADCIPFVPSEHMSEVEASLEEARRGLATPLSATDWSELREIANAAAHKPVRGA